MEQSNISIANRYRPRVFEDVRGQKSVVESLKGKIKDGKVPRTSLFGGAHGTGKTTVARILAKAVNCRHPKEDGNPCCQCESCLAIDAGVSGDVIELDAASHNKVEDVENIIKQASYLPTGNKKVIILDEAHMFSKPAQNKLLKVFEEPPAHVLFIFCTTEEGGLLETILSRCNKFTFNAISDNDIFANLKTVCAKEGIEYEEDALKHITKKANGHVRDSLSILEQLSYDKLTGERVREELGIPTDDQVFDLLQLVLLKDMQSVMKAVDTVIKQGNLAEFLKLLVETLCYICMFDESIEDTQTSSYRGYCAMIKENTTTAALIRFIQIITRSLRDNRGLGLDLATRLCFLSMITEVEKEDKVSALEEKVALLSEELLALKKQGGATLPAAPKASEPAQEEIYEETQMPSEAVSNVSSPSPDEGWQSTPDGKELPFEVAEMEFPNVEEMEEVPFSAPDAPAAIPAPVAEASQAGPLTEAEAPATQDVPSPVPFAIPGGTMVNTDDHNANKESEVLTDEPLTPDAEASAFDESELGSLDGMFGSTCARQWL